MKKILIIYNPKSGADDKDNLIEELRAFFLGQGYGLEQLEFIGPDSPQEAFQVAKQASLDKVDLVVSMGGDGTINKIAGGIHAGGSHSTLGILPSGTVNNFAKALDLPLEKAAAMENLLTGRPKAVDLAQVNDKTMISSLTLGFLADIAASVKSDDKRRLGKLAFVRDAFRILRRNRSYRLKLTYQGQTSIVKTKILVMAMTHSLAGITDFNPQADVNDGLLSCYYIEKLRLWKILRNLSQIRQGDFTNLSDIRYFRTQEIKIERVGRGYNPSSRLDGDKNDKLPLSITVFPQAIKVMVPET